MENINIENSEKMFNELLKNIKYKKVNKKNFNNAEINNTTNIVNFNEKINILESYNNIEINDLITNKYYDVKRKFLRLSIDYNSINHKNPINAKIFSNGKLLIIGCKLENELKNVILILLDILKINKKIEEILIKTSLINAKMNINQDLDLNKIYEFLCENYNSEEIHINNENNTKMIISLKIYDTIINKKIKTPTLILYNGGSLNIYCISNEILKKIEIFMKKLFNENFYNLISRELLLNEYL